MKIISKPIIFSERIYENIEQVENEVKNFLGDKKIESTLLGNYVETLKEYISYEEENFNININNFEIIE